MKNTKVIHIVQKIKEYKRKNIKKFKQKRINKQKTKYIRNKIYQRFVNFKWEKFNLQRDFYKYIRNTYKNT